MTTLKPLNGGNPEDCRLLYAIYTQDIRFAKQQQWRITYYALILMGAIAYFMEKSKMSYFLDIAIYPGVGIVLIFLVAFSSICLLVLINHNINVYREIIENMDETKRHNRNPHIDTFYSILFVGTIIMTGIFLCLFPITSK